MHFKSQVLFVLAGEEITKNQGVSGRAKLESNLGPDSAEYPLKPYYRTQNQAKRFNKLDNRNCFGNKVSEVQILSLTNSHFTPLSRMGFPPHPVRIRTLFRSVTRA
jgi:hypothetical protein